MSHMDSHNTDLVTCKNQNTNGQLKSNKLLNQPLPHQFPSLLMKRSHQMFTTFTFAEKDKKLDKNISFLCSVKNYILF